MIIIIQPFGKRQKDWPDLFGGAFSLELIILSECVHINYFSNRTEEQQEYMKMEYAALFATKHTQICVRLWCAASFLIRVCKNVPPKKKILS